jgi:hypothetical protein
VSEPAGEPGQQPEQVGDRDEQCEPEKGKRQRLDEAVDLQAEHVGALDPAVPDRQRHELERPAEQRERDERDRPGQHEVDLLLPESRIAEDGETAVPEPVRG